MTFWDSSALVTLLVDHPRSRALEAHVDADPRGVVWWATPVECASALARLEHDGRLSSRSVNAALARLSAVTAAFDEVLPTTALRSRAQRLVRSHRLRAADALQLAAAIETSSGALTELVMACLDDRLGEAARREGFSVVP